MGTMRRAQTSGRAAVFLPGREMQRGSYTVPLTVRDHLGTHPTVKRQITALMKSSGQTLGYPI